MKYLVYTAIVFATGLLFLPETGTTEIRNLPLLIFLLFLALLSIVVRVAKYAVLMAKTKKLLRNNGATGIRGRFLPFASWFHGHYSVVFQHQSRMVQFLLLARKRSYQRYHFNSIERLEFYRANRVVYKRGGQYEATISNLVEVNRVGRQKIKWNGSAEVRAVLFDKLPDWISDSVKKDNLAAGDRIGNSDVLVLDWSHLRHYVNETK